MTDRLGYGAVEDRTMPAVVYALYLLGFATAGLTSIVGVIVAYANRGAADTATHSHYTFQIRTFWIGLAAWAAAGAMFAVGLPLAFILIGIPMLLLAKLVFALTCIWFALRSILGVVYLARQEAYPRPYAFLA